MTPPPVMILAGGASRRMGGVDKGLRLLNGRPLLAHVIDRVAPQCDVLAINSNSPAEGVAALGLPVLPDSLPGRPGPLAGVLVAMDWAAASGSDAVVTVPGDTPFLPGDLIPRLMLRSEDAPGVPVVAQSGGRLHPVAALWPVALRDRLSAALVSGVRRMTDWTEDAGAIAETFPETEPDSFFNVNTPEDLALAEAALA